MAKDQKPKIPTTSTARKVIRRKFEGQALTRYLAESKGNVSKAAELAGLPRRTFHRLWKNTELYRRDIWLISFVLPNILTLK